jgi:tetratricopeptide (TPR) repeat protein
MEVVDGLASLVDKSLVQQKETTDGQPRFLLLEMIREYAWERLEASGEAETMGRRHVEYFVELAERAEPELHRANQLLWLDWLDEEHDNLRAALEWSLTNGEAELALRLVGALGWFWHMRSHAVEGYRWALRALEQGSDVAPTVRAKALHITGNRLLLNSGDYTAKRKFHEEALQIARENDDRYNLAWALIGLALVALGDRDHRETERLSKDALIVFRELDDKTGIGWALCCLGEAHRLHGNPQEAEPFYHEGLELFEAMGDRRGATMMLSNLAFVAYHQRHLQHARALFQKSYALNLLVGRQEEYANTLTGMAGIIAAQNEPERAVRLLAAADSLLETIGATTLFVAEQVDYKRILDNVRAQLDPATFEAAWAEGRAMTLEQAVADALEETL